MAREIIVDPQFVSEVGETSYPIRLCEEHDLQLRIVLEHKPELELTAFHIITRIAVNAIGTVNVTKFGCPICALQKFDYINELVPLIARGPKNAN